MSEASLPDPENFQDPLEDYSPKSYADPLEQALADNSVDQIRHEPLATISPEASVQDAVKQLAGLQVACLLVEQEGTLLGVFSHRDILEKVALEFDEVKDLPVRELMTDKPFYVYETDSAAAAFAVMAVIGHRHVPVLSVDHRLVGIISPQRVTAFLKNHFE